LLTQELFTKVQERFATQGKCILAHDQITLEVASTVLEEVCLTLRDSSEFQFAQLMDLCGVDYLSYGCSEWATDSTTADGFSRGVMHIKPTLPAARFAVVYHLLSVTLNQRIRLRVRLQGDTPHIPSVIKIWQSADWYEREAFDLFGIIFDGHPDLRRILTDYGFIGHPFRKDFPLIGQVEMRYDAGERRVLYEPVSIEPRTLVPKVIRYSGALETKD
jgi:NADH-quinone oxidoreductase subunit C